MALSQWRGGGFMHICPVLFKGERSRLHSLQAGGMASVYNFPDNIYDILIALWSMLG